MKKLFKYLFLIILSLFSLGQLQRIQLNEVIAFYAHDIFIAIWLVLITLNHHQKILSLIKKYFLNYLTGSLVIWTLIGITISFLIHSFSIIPLLYVSRIIAYLLFSLSLPLALPDSVKFHRYYWILASLFMAILGILQYLLLPDTRFLRYSGWDDHYFRLIGTQLDPNFTGILLVVSFILTQGMQFKQSWIKNSISGLLAGAILLTYSRASFLSFIIGSILIIFIGFIKSHKKNLFLSITIGLFVILIPFLPRSNGEGVRLERTASISARIESNQLALKNMKTYEWIFGKGLFVYQTQLQKESFWPNTAHFPNNLIVLLLSSVGIIGLGLSLIILYKISRNLYKKDIYIFIAFIAILIHSQFNHTLFQPFVWLWITNQILILEITKT